jgi:integrase
MVRPWYFTRLPWSLSFSYAVDTIRSRHLQKAGEGIAKVQEKLRPYRERTKEKIKTRFKRRIIRSRAQRKRSANKLGNQRLLKIHFHSLRHWKASTEYHRTKDILYVMHLLGHKNINSALIYTQLIESNEDDNYSSAIAHNVEEAQKLIEVGFDFVCSHNGQMLFRKRK